MRQKSLTFRLTLLFAAVSTTVLLLLGLLVGSLVESHFEELDQDLLDGKLELLQQALAGVRSPDDLAALPARLDEALVGHHGLAVAVWNDIDKPLYATPEADFPESLTRSPMPSVHRPIRWRGEDGLLYRGVSGSATLGIPGQAPLTVTVSTDLAHHEHFMHSFQTALWSVVGLAAMISGLLGWGAARQGLAPLREMSQDAAGITANRLNRRISAAAIPLELAEVAQTLNEMLARLEESFQRLSDFSSDLAHELRTPVTNLLTQTHVTLAKSRTADEYQEVLASNAEELDRLTRMIADMLFLAKADNDLAMPHPEPVNLREEVESILDYYAAVAEERDIRLSIAGQGVVAGDKLMLRRAIGNLVSNAFRHTPDGGGIRVGLDTANGQTTLSVENTGETIPAEHLPRLFDRFYRVDPSRHRHSEGVGLGLAITRSIIRAHGGDTAVQSANGTTTFTLKLPN